MSATSPVLEEARRLFEARAWAESEAAFRRVLASGEHTADASYGLGLVALARGDRPGATRHFEEALESDPSNSNALYYLAQLAEQGGDAQRAVSLYGATLYTNPNHAGALTRLAAIARAMSPVTNRTEPATSPGVQSPPAPPSAPTESDSYVGVVRNLQKAVVPWRGRPAAWQQWTFLLELRPDRGEPPEIRSVELRGNEIHGGLLEGHWVEISRREKQQDGALEPRRFTNLTTRGEVRVLRQRFLA
jgi:tetratricopeptide (TPR) repeat protein